MNIFIADCWRRRDCVDATGGRQARIDARAMAETNPTMTTDAAAGDGPTGAGDSTKASDTTATDGAGPEKKDEEPEEECGFCKFMKAGSCKSSFVAWEDCVDLAKEGDGDFVEKCAAQTEALRDCMLKDPGYYGDMLPDEGDGDETGAKKKESEEDEKGAKKKEGDDEKPEARAPVKQSRAAAALER